MSDLDLVCSACDSEILRTTSYQCPKCHKPRQVLEARITELEVLIRKTLTVEQAKTLAEESYLRGQRDLIDTLHDMVCDTGPQTLDKDFMKALSETTAKAGIWLFDHEARGETK